MPSARWSRRDFLTASLATTGWLASAACGAPFRPSEQPLPAPPRVHFAWGVASADPQPDAVLLWTRAAPVAAPVAGEGDVELVAQVATDPSFARVLLEQPLRAQAERDHTVRLLARGLEPDRVYFYRFVAGGDGSEVGRTRTAPAPDADRRVRLAAVSCQNYEQGFYGAWRRMIVDDEAAAPEDRIDFVLNLGDFIYEWLAPPGSAPLVDRRAHKRVIRTLPSGGGRLPSGRLYARTLDDYRFLYRTYLSDPDLRAARARWPFVSVWDDHEFTNDGWQSHVPYEPADPAGPWDPADPQRKLAANRAWFEYVPALLGDAGGVPGVEPAARDFSAPVRTGADAALDEAEAIASLTIYRSLRFGRHVELVLTDTRSYRSDQALPGQVAREAGVEMRLLPAGLVRTLDEGRTHAGGRPPATVSVGGRELPNPRQDSPPGWILGADQKAWWKATLAGSDATWKLWANSIPCSPLRLDLDLDRGGDPGGLALSIDGWDGYPTERAELLGFVADRGIANFVSLTGDHHMHFAATLWSDYDTAGARPVGAEFAVAAVSSRNQFRVWLSTARRDPELAAVTTFDHTRFGPRVELLNLTFMDGAAAARALSGGSEIEVVLRLANPDLNRHLRYVDANANGYGLLTVDGERLRVALVTVPAPFEDWGPVGSPVVRRALFELPTSGAVGAAALEGPRFEGKPPFPWDGIRRRG